MITKRVFIEHCLHLGTAPDVAELFFKTFDVDQSGTIDFQELAMYTALVATGSKSEKVEATFRVFDVDGDGTLSRSEVAQMLTHSVRLANALCMPIAHSPALADDPEYTNAQVEEVFAEADQDGDGVITLDEFKAVATVNKKLRGVLDFFYYLSNPKLISVNQEKAKRVRKAKLNALEEIQEAELPDPELPEYDVGYDSWDSDDEEENAAALQRAEGRYQRLLDAYISQYQAIADAAGAEAEHAIVSGQEILDVSEACDRPIDPIIAPDAAMQRSARGRDGSSKKSRTSSSDKSRKSKSKSRSSKDKDKSKSKDKSSKDKDKRRSRKRSS